jgi:hypothetical protein
VALGIGVALLGLIFAGLALLVVVAAALAATVPEMAPPRGSVSPTQALAGQAVGALMYLVLAAILLALGIATAQGRRWAHRLMVAITTLWLAIGAAGMVGLVVALPRLVPVMLEARGASPLAASELKIAMYVGIAVAVVIAAIGYLILPGALLLCYRTRAVSEDMATRRPEPVWTDSRSTTLLVWLLWQFLLGVAFIGTMAYGVLPFAGVILTGWPARFLGLLLGLLGLAAAWLLGRRSAAGWWLALVLNAVLLVSTVLSVNLLLSATLLELYGMPAVEAAQLAEPLAGLVPFCWSGVVLMALAMAWLARHTWRECCAPPTSRTTTPEAPHAGVS